MLAVLALGALPLLSLATARFSHRLHPVSLPLQNELGDYSGVVEESVAGIRVVKGFGTESRQEDQLAVEADQVMDRALAGARLRANFLPLVDFLPALALVIILGYGGHLVLQGQLQIGDLVAFNTYILYLLWPLRLVGMLVAQAARSSAAAGRIDELLATDAAITDPTHPAALPAGGGEVRFEGVRFAYGTGPPVLDGFDLVMHPGEAVALVGPTASGKTTVARLLPRFYDVDAGRVLIDGVDTRELSLRDLRRAIGIVFEDTFLFTDSVAENIAFAEPDASMDLIRNAARLAGADEFIDALPDGYDTLIGEHGYSLSGGQRQRVAIARAVLADPRVLILDDATSSVDPTKEHEIRSALREVMRAPDHAHHRPPGRDHRPRRPGGAPRRRPGRRRRHPRGAPQRLAPLPPAPQPDQPGGARSPGRGTDAERRPPGRLRERRGAAHPRGHVAAGAAPVGAPRPLPPARRLLPAPHRGVDRLPARRAGPGEARHRRRPDRQGRRRRSTSPPAATSPSRSAGSTFGRWALWSVSKIGEPFLRDLRNRVFRHLMSLDLGFFEAEQTGRLVARLTSDVDAMQDLVQIGLAQFAQNVFLFAGAVVVILVLSWKLALCILVVVPPVVWASRWFRRESSRAFLEVRDRIGHNLATLQEGLAGVRVVQAFGRERAFARRFRDTNEAQYDANLETVRISTRYFPFIEFCGVGGTALIIGIGGWFTDAHIVTVGTVAAFVLYLNNLFEPVQQLSQLYNTLQQAGAALKKLIMLLDTVPQIAERPDAHDLALEGDLEVDHVSFRYGDGPLVLHDVSITVPHGERLALVGPTGAGKSTLAKLMCRFYDPADGSVRFAGQSLADATLASLRERIVVVPQEGFLFAGTIRDNVRVARPDASDRDVDAALDALGVRDRFLALPEGLDTEVRERGSRLSAGERQLVSLARAALADPALLILDEATSNLDPGTERDVERALEALTHGRSVVVVAHRLSTAARADRIGVVDQGRLQELGTHDELLRREGRYASLWASWSAAQARAS